MKSTTLAALVISAFAGSSAWAQSLAVTASIPFDFHVGSSVMPAGKYLIQQGPASSTLEIRREDYSARLASITIDSIRSNDGKLAGVAKFMRHGDRYFLVGVWAPGAERGRVVPLSKSAKELLAASAVRSETIEIAVVFLPRS